MFETHRLGKFGDPKFVVWEGVGVGKNDGKGVYVVVE